MMSLVLRLTLWLAAGGVAIGGLFWLLLNTPEANALMLGASAAITILIVVVSAVIVGAGVLLAHGSRLGPAVRRGLGGVHWFVLAALPTAILWALAQRTDAWVAAHSGEINAWFIVRFGWADIDWLFQAQSWFTRWLRWIVMPLASLALLSQLLLGMPDGIGDSLRRAWQWRVLLPATLAFVVLATLPPQLIAWRPALPPTWIEPAVATLRIAAAALLWAAGAALLIALVAASRTPTVTPANASDSPQAHPA
jgi:hypothetical protein